MMRKLVLLLTAALLLASFTGCSTNISYTITDISEKVVDSNNGFAFDIFRALNAEDAKENVFISPFSISTALTMTYNGAETSTKTAMENTLGFNDLDRSFVNESYKNLIGHMVHIDKKIRLNIGNSIWIKEDQIINEKFITDNKNNFNAEVSTLDFSDPKATDTINNWIGNETNGMIKKMLEPPIAPDVVMYLINAIYFKGEWSEQFDPKRTVESSFNSLDGSNQPSQMMNRHDTVLYTQGEDYKAVRLPYGKGKTSMNIILPDKDIDINEYIKELNTEMWVSIRESFKEVDDVQLSIPKFKLEYGIKNLNDSLKALGMEEAFSDHADFSGIRQDIKISRVLHKAVIEVNEEGSEAAAATIVEMVESAAPMEPITFIADRPFIFFITDDVTGTIMFMGKVSSL